MKTSIRLKNDNARESYLVQQYPEEEQEVQTCDCGMQSPINRLCVEQSAWREHGGERST